MTCLALILTSLTWCCTTQAFPLLSTTITNKQISFSTALSSFAVPAEELEDGLTPPEKAVIRVVRRASPSVAFVTSIWPTTSAAPRQRRRSPSNRDTNLPPGQSLGSGSGFVVEADGYIVTNYHVIERAYRLQETRAQSVQQMQEFMGNVSQYCNLTTNLFPNMTLLVDGNLPPPPKVYCRINSATQFQPCRIVNVKPELDLCVLKIENSTIASWQTVDFGSSSQLLVGQSLVAIGNPFGLDQTVTAGVVSALNREIMVEPGKVIRNCVQTDCAVNPGNSGGPLLNLEGRVVGVNTAIVTTSGSNAGIGFAVPSDKVQPAVQEIVRSDRLKKSRAGYLGVGILKLGANVTKLWINRLDPGSPASKAGMVPLELQGSGRVIYGDAIVAVGGNFVSYYDDLVRELHGRVVGEEVAITLERADGERRVVYVKLSEKPHGL
jgi:S1-C subfamily serine protease